MPGRCPPQPESRPPGGNGRQTGQRAGRAPAHRPRGRAISVVRSGAGANDRRRYKDELFFGYYA